MNCLDFFLGVIHDISRLALLFEKWVKSNVKSEKRLCDKRVSYKLKQESPRGIRPCLCSPSP